MERQNLYRPEELNTARAAQKRIRLAMLAVAGLGLAACVLLCCFTTRQNQRQMLLLAVGASALFGWIVIFLSHSRYALAKAAVRHLELMLTGPRERFSGRFEKLDGVYRVKRGVSIRKVRLQEDLHETLLTVYDQKAALLPDDFAGTVETVYDCIVAFEATGAVAETEPSEKAAPVARGAKGKGILRNWHRYLLWATVSFFFWAWIFTWITDAPAGKKLVLYADCPAMEREELSSALEADMPEGIRFVEARIFSDEMFSPSNLSSGDLFIVSSAQIEKFRPLCTSFSKDAFPGRSLLEIEGEVCGVCVYDEELETAIGTRYVAYIPGERYYLFFNAASKHLGSWNGSADDAALRAARTLLSLP